MDGCAAPAQAPAPVASASTSCKRQRQSQASAPVASVSTSRKRQHQSQAPAPLASARFGRDAGLSRQRWPHSRALAPISSGRLSRGCSSRERQLQPRTPDSVASAAPLASASTNLERRGKLGAEPASVHDARSSGLWPQTPRADRRTKRVVERHQPGDRMSDSAAPKTVCGSARSALTGILTCRPG